MTIFIELVGWLGALLVLGAYILVSAGRLSGSSVVFQWMNALGAAFFVLNTWCMAPSLPWCSTSSGALSASQPCGVSGAARLRMADRMVIASSRKAGVAGARSID